MKAFKHLPNTITCLNLISGCFSIYSVFNGNLYLAAIFIALGAIFDFLDGFIARMIKAYSEIGKQLDSLADVVTFGVAPGFIMMKLIEKSWSPYTESIHQYTPFLAFIIPALSALRLAKFNIDTRQTDKFIGVPTPANAILILSFPLIEKFESATLITSIIGNELFLIATTLLFSLLLVSELPLFALKFKHFKYKGNEERYIFLILSTLSLIFLKFTALPIAIILYILISIIVKTFNKNEI